MPRTWFVAIGLALWAATGHASDLDDVKARFSAYWQAFVDGDYASATRYLNPADLSGLASKVQPTLLRALASSDARKKELATEFLEGVPAEKRGKLSDEEFYAQFLAIAGRQLNENSERLRHATIHVDSLIIDSADPNNGVLKYTINVAGVTGSAMESVVRVNGQWFIRPKQTAANTAAVLQKLFGD